MSETRERRLREFAKEVWRLVEEEWDRRKLTPLQRRRLILKAEAVLDKLKEKRRGH